MKPILLFACLLVITNAWSNPTVDSLPGMNYRSPLHEQNYRPIFRLTAKDLAHLPVINLVEFLNGRFPFAFADAPATSMYAFLVDGYVALNPNAINITQIELIEFYPVSFDATNSSLSARGTFVITTKRGKNDSEGFTIRSQTGALIGTDKAVPRISPGFTKEFEPELFTHQEVGYHYNKQKLQLNAAGAFTKSGIPNSQQINSGFLQYNFHNSLRERFSLFGGYEASERFKISLALLGTWTQQTAGGNLQYPIPTPVNYYDSDGDLFYRAAAVAFEYRHRNFTNVTQFIYSRLRSESDYLQVAKAAPPNPEMHRNDHTINKNTRVAIVNTTKGTFNSNGKVHAGWQLILRYHQSKDQFDYSSTIALPSSPPSSVSTGTSTWKERSLAMMPALSMDIDQKFFAIAGVTLDTWKNSTFLDDHKELALPYFGMRWAPKLNSRNVTSIVLHSTYGKSFLFDYRADLLDMYTYPGQSPAQAPNMALGQPNPGYTWITGLNAGLAKNRLLISVNYLIGNGFPGIMIPIPGGMYLLEMREVNRSGASVDVQMTISSERDFNCRFRTNLFYERIELKEKIQNPIVYYDNPFLNDDLSPQWRGSASIDITSDRFFMHVQALLRFNDEGYNQPFFADRKGISNHGLTFFALGYSIPLKQTAQNPRIDISIQTRNLIVMEEPRGAGYYGSKYVGVGVNLEL